MKYQLLKTAEGFETVVSDENKMIPDPAFLRVFKWLDFPPLQPQQQGESAADFQKRQADHAAEFNGYKLNMETESTRLYTAEFSKTAPVVVEEKVI